MMSFRVTSIYSTTDCDLANKASLIHICSGWGHNDDGNALLVSLFYICLGNVRIHLHILEGP